MHGWTSNSRKVSRQATERKNATDSSNSDVNKNEKIIVEFLF